MDIDEQIKAQRDILEKLSNFDTDSFKTKKQYIEELKDVTRPLIESGYYENVKLDDFCSFIGDLLEKYNISYSRKKLPALFEDNEKRVYTKEKTNVTDGDNCNSSPPESEGIEGIIRQLNRARTRAYDDIDYDYGKKINRMVDASQRNADHLTIIRKRLFTARYFTDYFEKNYTIESFEKMIKQYPKDVREQLTDILAAYHASVLLQSETELNIAENYDDGTIREIEARQDHTSKNLDERIILSTWEKITIFFAMTAGKIAKGYCAKLNGIDKKHITNNIMPQANPVTGTRNKIHDIMRMSWFKTMRVQCAKCKHVNTFDATQKIEEDLSRSKLSLQAEPTVLVNCEVE